MRLTPSIAVLLSLFAAGPALADNACLVEGQFAGTPIRDCTQTSRPVPAAQYAAQCASNTRSDGMMTMKATVVNACPPQAQGACAIGGQTAYYYARTPQMLAASRKSCLAQGGKWNDHP